MDVLYYVRRVLLCRVHDPLVHTLLADLSSGAMVQSS